jgi:hypothetical protein
MAAGLALFGCESSVSTDSSRVRLHLTDAPGPGIASAQVWISRAYLVPGQAGEQVVLTSDPQEYDLLTLQDGVTALLGDATVPTGDYAQLRLVVDSARLTLEDGASFADGSASRTLKVPSGPQTGIKVNFAGGLHITEDTDLLVDFSVADNFVFQGPPARPMGVLFTPHLKGSASPAQPE